MPLRRGPQQPSYATDLSYRFVVAAASSSADSQEGREGDMSRPGNSQAENFLGVFGYQDA